MELRDNWVIPWKTAGTYFDERVIDYIDKMSFELRIFVSLTLEEINSLTRVNLLVIAQHYKLSVTDAITKGQLKKSVVQYLQEEEILDSSDTGELGKMISKELLQLKQLEFHKKEKEREAQLRLKEFEFKEKEVVTQLKNKELEQKVAVLWTLELQRELMLHALFDVSKHIRFVPTFS